MLLIFLSTESKLSKSLFQKCVADKTQIFFVSLHQRDQGKFLT